MAFGKKGRPPEDRLARQREIYTAVAPLILETGARRLSMRQAARASSLSIGGLYHYFPTKRDLVLHGLCPEAILRYCEDFHAQCGPLAQTDPRQYIDAGIDVVVQQVAFCRPAIHAALEFGYTTFWDVIDTLLAGTLLEFEANLQRVVPEVSDEELQRWGRTIRRFICAALMDKDSESAELRDDLRNLVGGYLAPAARPQQRSANGLVGSGKGAPPVAIPG